MIACIRLRVFIRVDYFDKGNMLGYARIKGKERMKGNIGKEQEQIHKHVHSEEEKKKVVNRIA